MDTVHRSCIPHIAICGLFLLRWLSKLVVLPRGAATTFWHTLYIMFLIHITRITRIQELQPRSFFEAVAPHLQCGCTFTSCPRHFFRHLVHIKLTLPSVLLNNWRSQGNFKPQNRSVWGADLTQPQSLSFRMFEFFEHVADSQWKRKAGTQKIVIDARKWPE